MSIIRFDARFYYSPKEGITNYLSGVVGTTTCTLEQLTNKTATFFLGKLDAIFLASAEKKKISLPPVEKRVKCSNVFRDGNIIYLMLWIGIHEPAIRESESRFFLCKEYFGDLAFTQEMEKIYKGDVFSVKLELEAIMLAGTTKMHLTLLNQILFTWNKAQLSLLTSDTFLNISPLKRKVNEILTYVISINEEPSPKFKNSGHHLIRVIEYNSFTIIYLPIEKWSSRSVLKNTDLFYHEHIFSLS